MKIDVQNISGESFPLNFEETEVSLDMIRKRLNENYKLNLEKINFFMDHEEMNDSSKVTKDGSTLVMYDSGIYSEKSYPTVDNAFAFGSLFRYSNFYNDMETQKKEEEVILNQFYSGRKRNSSRFKLGAGEILQRLQEISLSRNDFNDFVINTRNDAVNRGNALLEILGLISQSRNYSDDGEYEEIEIEDENENENLDDETYDDDMNNQQYEDYDEDEDEENDSEQNDFQEGNSYARNPFILNNEFAHGTFPPEARSNEFHFNFGNPFQIDLDNTNLQIDINNQPFQVGENFRDLLMGINDQPAPEMNLTPEEEEAVRRIMSHGYSRRNVLEFFDACEHDEMATLNCLESQN